MISIRSALEPASRKRVRASDTSIAATVTNASTRMPLRRPFHAIHPLSATTAISPSTTTRNGSGR